MKADRATALVYKENKILLIHRIKPGMDYYVLPGGKVEEGELGEDTVLRELKEETSIEGKLIKKVHTLIDEEGRTHHLYLCEYISGTPALAPDSPEAIDMKETNQYIPVWMDISEIPKISIWPEATTAFLENYFKSL